MEDFWQDLARCAVGAGGRVYSLERHPGCVTRALAPRIYSLYGFLQNRNNCYDLCCMPTATDHIVALLLAERDRLNRAIEAIQGSVVRSGGPPRTPAAGLSAAGPKKRHVSAASRRRMALAQKRRWAAARRAARS
jgi:hypothetical protein